MKPIAIFLDLIVLTILVFYNLPFDLTNRAEIKKGNRLIKNIEN